jgi:hypothetical protein
VAILHVYRVKPGYSSRHDGTSRGPRNAGATVCAPLGSCYDEDIAFDDDVQGFSIPPGDLAYAAGRGEIEGPVWGNIYWLNLGVSAHFR